MTDPRYPIGPFLAPESPEAERVQTWIAGIESLPAELRAVVGRMRPEQLDTSYRPGGWTARQVVHHVLDSHINSYCRFKLGLTEDRPTIRGYDEGAWVLQPDARCGLDDTLDLLELLHRRWVVLLRALGPDELARTYYHPEPERHIPLWEAVGTYDWHGRHHLAHVELVADSRP